MVERFGGGAATCRCRSPVSFSSIHLAVVRMGFLRNSLVAGSSPAPRSARIAQWQSSDAALRQLPRRFSPQTFRVHCGRTLSPAVRLGFLRQPVGSNPTAPIGAKPGSLFSGGHFWGSECGDTSLKTKPTTPRALFSPINFAAVKMGFLRHQNHHTDMRRP